MLGFHDVHPTKINCTEARLNFSGQACFEGPTMVYCSFVINRPYKTNECQAGTQDSKLENTQK